MKKIFTLFTLFILSMSMAMQAQQVQRISRTSQPKITLMVKHNVNAVQRAESSVAPVQDADRAEAKARHNAPDAKVSPRRDAFPSFNYFNHTDGSNNGESFTWAQTTVSYLSNTNTPYYNVRGYKDLSTYQRVSETWCFSNNSSYLPSGEYLSANTLAEGTMGVGSSTSDIRSYGGYVDWYDDGTFNIWIFGKSDYTFAWVHNPNHSAKPMYFYSQGASYYNSKTWWTEIGTEPTQYTITFTWGNNGVEDGNEWGIETEEIIFGVEGNTFTMYNQSVFTLTPQPKPGWRFVSWTGTGANEITNNGDGTYRLQMNGKNYSIAAVFEEIPPVDVTLSPNGGSGSSQIVSAMNGSAMPTTLKGGGSIVAPTRTGYVFGGYVANTNGTGKQYYNANLTSANTWDKDVAATIYAKWTAEKYNFIYKDQGNVNYSGNNSSSLVAQHTYGTSTTLVAGAKNGYTFGGWYDNPSCSGNPITTIGATAYTSGPITLYAKWTQNVYHLNLTSGGNGTVSRSDNGTSSTDLHAGDQITLSYTPAGGYGFVNWTGTGSAYVSNNVFTVPNGTNGTTYTVQANFAPTHTITVTADPVAGGTVSGGGTYGEGANVTLTATPNSGYSFSRWSDGNTSNPRNVTMGNDDAIYTAEFVQQLYDYEYRFSWSTDRVSTDFGQKTSGGNRTSNKWYLLRTNVKKNANSNPGLQIDMTTSQGTGTNGYKSYSNNKLPNPGTYTNTIASVGNNRGRVITSASSGGTTYSTKFTDADGTAHTLSSLDNGKVQYIDVAGETYPFVYIKGTFTTNKTVFATIGVAPTYTVTLNSQRSGVNATTSGTTSVTATYTYNTNLTSPITIPTLTGYTFGGYWTNNGGTGTQIIDADGNFKASVSGYTDALKRWFKDSNITLYAKWTANTYYVAFVAGEGSGTAMTNQTFTYGTAQNLKANTYVGPAATVTYNYHGATSGNSTTSETVNAPFDRWEESLTEEWYEDKESVNRLTAVNGATLTMTALWGSTYPSVQLPTPEKDGYTLNGWYTAETGGTLKGAGGASYTPTGDITLHAQWSIKTYAITYNAGDNGTGSIAGGSKTHDVSFTLSNSTFTRTGYKQTGWSLTDGGEHAYDLGGSYTTNSAQEFFPVWTPDTYDITYKDQGDVAFTGTHGTGYPTSHTYGTQTTLVNANDKAGYRFGGWYDNADCTGDALTTIGATAKTADFTLYAKWIKLVTFTIAPYTNGTVTVSYTDNGAQAFTSGSRDIPVGTLVSFSAVANTNYHITNVDLSGSSFSASSAYTLQAGDGTKTLTANFLPDTYAITYNKGANGTGSIDAGEKTYGVNFTLSSSTFTRTGYTQTGWSLTDGGNKAYELGGSYTTNSAQEFFPFWTVNQHNISWVTDGNTLTGDYTHGTTDYGTTIVAPNTPTKNATEEYTYAFDAWSPTPAATMPDNDVTYTANFTATPVEYTITYHLNGGEGADNGSYTYESATITLPTAEDMTKANHTFAGWYNNAELEGNAVTVVAAGSTGDKEFWAKWTLNGYVITFMDYDGETTLQSTAVAQGTRPSITDPTRSDDEVNNIAYSFIGWKSSADENVYTTANLPVATAVVTYTAQYEPYFLIRDDKANGDAYYGALAAQAGKTLDVKYKRTFPKGRWSTLSLPFAYSFRTNINPFDGKLYYLISANYTADGYLTLNCMPVTTGIEANKAYILILGEEDENIVNPTFKGAKMKELEHKYYTAPNVDGIGNGVIFRNTIERETLEKDKRVIYLSGNRLYYPNLAPEASSWIYPFRGYFYLNIAEGQIQYSPARVRLVNEEGETIETLPEASEETSAEVKKYIENGILVIERAGIKYDAQGHIIK